MSDRHGLDLFISYVQQDKALRAELEVHLAPLKKQGLVRTWHDHLILPGDKRRESIDGHLAAADVVLLLVSPNYLASDERWNDEVKTALKRHKAGAARVVPIILRLCDWRGTPFGRLQPLPQDGEPVVRRKDRDEAWLEVSQGLRTLAEAEPRGGGVDKEHDQRCRQLDELYEQREQLTINGGDVRNLDREILDVRRLLRRGPQLHPGEFLADGRFKLVESLGHGGFATVWKAYDRQLHRLVAVKVLHGQHTGDRSRRERFFRGARKMEEMAHPYIVRVLEREIEDEGWYFFVMEYVTGGDLHQAVVAGKLSMADKLRVVSQVGQALKYAHGLGLVHRDVKPLNILLDENLQAKLTDFDLVRAEDTTGLTATQAMMGTLNFAAPEALASAGAVGPAADVYSLGTTAVFALRGGPLPVGYYRGPSRAVEALEVSEQMRRVLTRATAAEMADRFSTVEEFCGALEGAVDDDSDVGKGHWQDPVLSMEFVSIEPGAFWMGSPETEAGRGTDEGRHRVELTQGFWMGKTAVTQAQFKKFVDESEYKTEAEQGDGSFAWDGSRWTKQIGVSWKDSGGPEHPIVHVSWNDAQAFCQWLSGSVEGTIRLPTEAEWEYAARAGTETATYRGDLTNVARNSSELEDIAWYSGNSSERSQLIGRKSANDWGLHDMLGNIWEWVADWYEKYPENLEGAVAEDPTGPQGGSFRVVRGGGWNNHARNCRSANRHANDPSFRRDIIGFRVVRTYS